MICKRKNYNVSVLCMTESRYVSIILCAAKRLACYRNISHHETFFPETTSTKLLYNTVKIVEIAWGNCRTYWDNIFFPCCKWQAARFITNAFDFSFFSALMGGYWILLNIEMMSKLLFSNVRFSASFRHLEGSTQLKICTKMIGR